MELTENSKKLQKSRRKSRFAWWFTAIHYSHYFASSLSANIPSFIPPHSNMSSTLQQSLEKIVNAKHLSKHPFYRLWDEGKLSQEQLQQYSKQYYHLEWNFPLLLSLIHSHCKDIETRKVLVKNLYEEELESTHHSVLWRQFQTGLGVAEETQTNASLLPETEATLAILKNIASSRSVNEGLAAMFAYEAMLPEVCRLKIDGLKKHYGIEDPKTIEFFTTHLVADEKHSLDWVKLLQNVNQPEELSKLEKAASDTCDALNLFLDGVLKSYVTVQC